jgi:hypothetical protein
MDMPFTFESAVVRRQASYFSAERLATLKNIFETVCDEAAIRQRPVAIVTRWPPKYWWRAKPSSQK